MRTSNLIVAAILLASSAAAQDPAKLTTPSDPLTAVREAFAAAAGRVRVLAVLSPT